jgi:hypothetical protein
MAGREKTSSIVLKYIIKRIVIIALLVLVLTVVFVMAMDITNIYVLLSDGFKEHTQGTLIEYDADAMTKYFTPHALQTAEFANDRSTYSEYIIRDFEHNLSLEWIWITPWSDTATATVVEKVSNIDGDIPSDAINASKGIPAWIDAKYEITLKKVYNETMNQNVWQIDSVHLLNRIAPSPSPSISSLPSSSPSISPKSTTSAAPSPSK